MADISLTTSSAASSGGLGFPNAQPRSMWRERDVRRAIAELLQSTGAFDGVYLGSLPERKGRRTSARAIAILPNASQLADLSDAAPAGRIAVSATLKLVVIASDENEEIRDSAAEQLLAVTANALNGQNLGGLTMPQFTRLQGWTWKNAEPPERRIETMLGFRYLLDSWTGFNESE